MEPVYGLLMGLLLPFALLRLLGRSLRLPAYRQRWGERLGIYPGGLSPAALWVHAVSVGEVQAAFPLIKALLERHPGFGVVVTTTTPTGAERLRQLLGEQVQHVYTPYDLLWVVGRFLDQFRPRLVVILETEIWPSLLTACQGRGIAVILANARLSERSARGYARLGAFSARLLRRFTLIAAQSQADAHRFLALGADPGAVRVTGSLKFDVALPASLRERSAVVRRLLGSARPLWVAGSTHEGEEEVLLAAHQRVLSSLPDALLVLVPRHPERFTRVAALVKRQGLPLVARSEDRPCERETAVFLGDTLGELAVFFAAADAAFIGGSLVPGGGHNLLEAAAAGLPVAVGAHTFNFAEITGLMVERGVAVRVQGAEDLARLLVGWLSNPTERARVGEEGRRVVEENRGALQQLLGLVEEQLAQNPGGSGGRQAPGA